MDLTAHMDRLVAALDPAGRGEISESIKDAVRAVPRHQFIPDVGLVRSDDGEPYLIDREAEPDAWYEAVYSRHAIVTQLDDGRTPLTALKGDYTSSASQPGTVADLLHHLQAEPGMRVLEVGTGTGWTAALLSHLVGDQGEVTSIEVDTAVAEQAAKNLGEAGFQPRLLVGDGALGCTDFAPYDRVHVTCGIRHVPYAWVEQSRPGGVIVLPWRPASASASACAWRSARTAPRRAVSSVSRSTCGCGNRGRHRTRRCPVSGGSTGRRSTRGRSTRLTRAWTWPCPH